MSVYPLDISLVQYLFLMCVFGPYTVLSSPFKHWLGPDVSQTKKKYEKKLMKHVVLKSKNKKIT